MKTAKILSLVALAVAGAGMLMVAGWMVWAQDSSPPPPAGASPPGEVNTGTSEGGTAASTNSIWVGVEPPGVQDLSQRDSRAVMEPFWQQARQAQADSQWDLAGRRFADIANRLPEGSHKQNALLQGGKCLAQAGRIQEAVAKYDEVLAIGSQILQGGAGDSEVVSHRKRVAGFAITTIKDNMLHALYGKVVASRQAGDDQKALQAIQYMRAWFPAFNNLKKVLPIAAQIEGQDARRLLADEEAAETLVEQAKKAGRAKQSDQAIQLADQVLSQYPDTAAALAARNAKAEILWLRGSHEDANVLYEEIKASLETIAPDCPLAREAQWHCAFLEASDLAKKLIPGGHDKNFPEADWQRAHELCGVVCRWATEDLHRAEMALLSGELYYWPQQYPEALALFDGVVRAFEKRIARQQGKDIIQLKNIVMMARQFAGYVHLKSGDLDAAIQQFTTVMDACKDDPNAVHHANNPIAAGACLGLWYAYSSKADQAGMLSMESLMKDRWPDGGPARYLKFAKAKLASGQ